MTIRVRSFASILFAAFLLLCALPSRAQEITGSISGTVTDASGAAIKGATVRLTSTDRNLLIRTVETNSAGYYTAPSLVLGGYQVVVSQPQFGDKKFTGIVLHANDTLTLNATLKAGAEVTVEVSAAQLQLDLESGAQQSVIDGTQVRELMLSTRNYEQLVGLQPGVAYTGGDQIYIGNSNPSGAPTSSATPSTARAPAAMTGP